MTYYSILKKINTEICNNDSQIRDNTSINIIDNAIEEAINSQDEETLIKAMKVAALIKLFQPFYDGNHRTALIIFGNIISQKGYTFDYQTALNDMKNKKLNRIDRQPDTTPFTNKLSSLVIKSCICIPPLFYYTILFIK
jgi:fido (protein-threonine AMPylation protein)